MANKKIVKLLCGAEAEIVEGEELEEIKRVQVYADDGIILPMPGKPQIPKIYLTQEHLLYNFKFRPTDIFVVGPMKTGTTWLHEIVWTMCHNPDLSNPTATYNVFLRLPWFDTFSFLDVNHPMIASWSKCICEIYNFDGNVTDIHEVYPNPRIFKSHLPPYLLNPKIFEMCKIIYITRHPMDSFQSYYHYVQNMDHQKFKGTLDEFTSTYIKGEMYLGNAVFNMKEWWPYRNHKNVNFILYEDLKKEPHQCVKQIGDFLNKNLSEEHVNNIVKQTDFKTMRDVINKETIVEEPKISETEQIQKLKSKFFREGKSGTAKESLPKEVYDKLAAYFDKELKDFDLPYQY